MHELSLVQGLLNIACDEANKCKALKIQSINLNLGLLTCVEEQTLLACFEVLRESTIAQDAILTIKRDALPCYCNNCKNNFDLHSRLFVCPVCNHKDLDFNGGHGCYITNIKVEIIDH